MEPKTLGVTGGIGMGKSVAGRLLEERGLQVIDTDILAREVVEDLVSGLFSVEEMNLEVCDPGGWERIGRSSPSVSLRTPNLVRNLSESYIPHCKIVACATGNCVPRANAGCYSFRSF